MSLQVLLKISKYLYFFLVFSTSYFLLVPQERIALPTYPLEGDCYYLLSYWGSTFVKSDAKVSKIFDICKYFSNYFLFFFIFPPYFFLLDSFKASSIDACFKDFNLKSGYFFSIKYFDQGLTLYLVEI